MLIQLTIKGSIHLLNNLSYGNLNAQLPQTFRTCIITKCHIIDNIIPDLGSRNLFNKLYV